MYDSHDIYMQRCIDLALLGAGRVAPNPMVGAVLVHDNRIIGEGYHQQYGSAHAEVNCIASVPPEDQSLLPLATLYVSLEPCAHFGKTPPCADLIIEKKIPHVVIGCQDPYAEVNGKGIEKLRNAGIKVTTGVLEEACILLNTRFFTFHRLHRPYVILKWAQTADGRIAYADQDGAAGRLQISNEISNRLVHRWRSEEAAILVGRNTALQDNPSLTTRLWPGKNPLRLVLDPMLRLPLSLQLFSDGHPTFVFNYEKTGSNGNLKYCRVNRVETVQGILRTCYAEGIQSILVEGGAQLLQSFIDAGGCWDEARVITNTEMRIGKGLAAPSLPETAPVSTEKLASDIIHLYKRITP